MNTISIIIAMILILLDTIFLCLYINPKKNPKHDPFLATGMIILGILSLVVAYF